MRSLALGRFSPMGGLAIYSFTPLSPARMLLKIISCRLVIWPTRRGQHHGGATVPGVSHYWARLTLRGGTIKRPPATR